MNEKGILCFVLLLAFFAIQTRFLAETSEASRKIDMAEELGFEAEKAWLARAVMEENVDLAIKETLNQGLLLNLGPKETKIFVNSKLVLLFVEMEKTNLEGIVIEFKPESKNLQFLNENSAIAIEAIDKKTIITTYYFTGGLLKNKKVYAEIKGTNTMLEFEIPAGYSIKESVVG